MLIPSPTRQVVPSPTATAADLNSPQAVVARDSRGRGQSADRGFMVTQNGSFTLTHSWLLRADACDERAAFRHRMGVDAELFCDRIGAVARPVMFVGAVSESSLSNTSSTSTAVSTAITA